MISMKIFKLNSTGFSLVEVMIAAGISGVVAYLILTLTFSQTKSNKNTVQVENFNQLVALIQTLIGNPTTCAKAFSGISYGPGAQVDINTLHKPKDFLPGSAVPASGNNIPCINRNGLTTSPPGSPNGGCTNNSLTPSYYNPNSQGVIVSAQSRYKDIYISHINFTQLPDYTGNAYQAPSPLVSRDALDLTTTYKSYVANLSIHAQKVQPTAGSIPPPGSNPLGGKGINDMVHNFPLAITTVTQPTQPDILLSCESRFPTSMTGPLCNGLGGRSFNKTNPDSPFCVFPL